MFHSSFKLRGIAPVISFSFLSGNIVSKSQSVPLNMASLLFGVVCFSIRLFGRYAITMFLKLLKGIIFLLAAGVITYCVIHNQNFSVKPQSEKHVKNSAKKIKYKKRLNGGMLTLMAKSADVSVEGSILLTDVIATFEKNKKTITIRCENCNLKPKKQRAYLKKNVCIKTGNAICYTDAATVNFVENSIFGKSKMHGIQSGTKFVSNGFLMKEDGKIKLNKAKIVKNKRQ